MIDRRRADGRDPPGRRRCLARHRLHLLVDVGARPDVDPQHLREGAETGNQAGVGAARAVGHHDDVDVIDLGAQLVDGGHVAQRADGRGASDRDEVRPASPVDEARHRGLDGILELVVLHRAGPLELRAEEVVEDHVAGGHGRQPARHHGHAPELEAGGGRRRQAHVVALASAPGDQGVAPSRQRVGGQELELAHLVPAAAEAGQVVALDQQAAVGEAEVATETVQRVHRCGEHGERHARQVGHQRADATVT